MSEKKVFETYRGFVMAQETDSNGHMNVQFYTTKYDQATGQLLTVIGYNPQKVKANNKGFAYLEMILATSRPSNLEIWNKKIK